MFKNQKELTYALFNEGKKLVDSYTGIIYYVKDNNLFTMNVDNENWYPCYMLPKPENVQLFVEKLWWESETIKQQNSHVVGDSIEIEPILCFIGESPIILPIDKNDLCEYSLQFVDGLFFDDDGDFDYYITVGGDEYPFALPVTCKEIQPFIYQNQIITRGNK
ncbi:MAG: hypothetical protein WC679_01070 [Bacteroidales bacterium]|jgi:hypothetical protein